MNLNSNGFKLPVYIAKGVYTSGHVADIGPLQIGVFDAQNHHVATGLGNGKEFYLSGGSPHTKDQLSKFYHGMKERKDSTPFFGKDIESFKKAYPTRAQSEQWVLGYGGAKDDGTLKFQCGKTYKLRVRVFGEHVFRTFTKSLDKIIPLTTECCDTDACDFDCTDKFLGVKKQTRAWVKAFNDNIEMQELKVKAYPVFSDYAATAATVNDYTLTVPDNGDASALQDVQRAYGSGVEIERKSFANGTSVYVVKGLAAAPADYTPKSYSIPVVNCDECEAGTYVPPTNTYIVKRPLDDAEDIDDATARTAYATDVVTDYGGVVGSGKFLGVDNGQAIVRFQSSAVEADQLSDDLELIAEGQPYCEIAAAAAIAWEEGTGGYTIDRTMRITVPDEDCSQTATVADLENHLSGLKNPVVVTEVTDTVGTGNDADNCVKVFQVVQTSAVMKDDYCMTVDNEQFEDLPSYKGVAFEEVPGAEVYDATIKAGIRFVAPLYSQSFSDFSYQLGEYWDSEPTRMEVSVYEEDFEPCQFGKQAKARRVVGPKYQRLSGEWVRKFYIERNSAYFPFEEYDANDTRMNEVIDNTALSQINRNSYFVKYTLKYKEARDKHNFNQKKQHWEPVIFVEEGDRATQEALELAFSSITSKFDVDLEVDGSI